MANFSKLGVVVTSAADAVNKIKAFLVASAPGPGWTEDATYTNAGHTGELFIRSAGATSFYLYFNAAIVAAESGGAEQGIRAWWLPATGNGYGGSAAPTAKYSYTSALIGMTNVWTYHTVTLDLFADANRVVVAWSAVPKGNAPATAVACYSLLYAGGYTSHADAADDTYPLVVCTNGRGLYSGAITEVFGFMSPNALINGTFPGYFPDTVYKRIGPSDASVLASHGFGGEWRPAHPISTLVPKNSRGGTAFAYQQGIRVHRPGCEESFDLTGVYIGHGEHGVRSTITIDSADYYSLPAILNPENLWFGRSEFTLSSWNHQVPVILVPLGTTVP